MMIVMMSLQSVEPVVESVQTSFQFSSFSCPVEFLFILLGVFFTSAHVRAMQSGNSRFLKKKRISSTIPSMVLLEGEATLPSPEK